MNVDIFAKDVKYGGGVIMTNSDLISFLMIILTGSNCLLWAIVLYLLSKGDKL